MRNKVIIVNALTGILCGSSLSAEEVEIRSNVFDQLPQISDIQDRQTIAAFLNENASILTEETIRKIEKLAGLALLTPEAVSKYAAKTETIDIEEGSPQWTPLSQNLLSNPLLLELNRLSTEAIEPSPNELQKATAIGMETAYN